MAASRRSSSILVLVYASRGTPSGGSGNAAFTTWRGVSAVESRTGISIQPGGVTRRYPIACRTPSPGSVPSATVARRVMCVLVSGCLLRPHLRDQPLVILVVLVQRLAGVRV